MGEDTNMALRSWQFFESYLCHYDQFPCLHAFIIVKFCLLSKMLTLVNLLTMRNQRWLDSYHQHISVTVFFRATGWGSDVTATTSGDWQRDKSSTYSVKYMRLRRGEDKWALASEALTLFCWYWCCLNDFPWCHHIPITTECRQVHPLLPQHTPGRRPLQKLKTP